MRGRGVGEMTFRRPGSWRIGPVRASRGRRAVLPGAVNPCAAARRRSIWPAVSAFHTRRTTTSLPARPLIRPRCVTSHTRQCRRAAMPRHFTHGLAGLRPSNSPGLASSLHTRGNAAVPRSRVAALPHCRDAASLHTRSSGAPPAGSAPWRPRHFTHATVPQCRSAAMRRHFTHGLAGLRPPDPPRPGRVTSPTRRSRNAALPQRRNAAKRRHFTHGLAALPRPIRPGAAASLYTRFGCCMLAPQEVCAK